MTLNKVCDLKYADEYKQDASLSKYVEYRGDEVCGCTFSNVYDDYVEFCKDKDYEPMKYSYFKQRFPRQHGFATIVRKLDGKCVRVVVKKS